MAETSIHSRFFKAYQDVNNPKLDSVNPHFNSRFASLLQVLGIVKPALQKQGLLLSQFIAIVNEQAYMTTCVIDESGDKLLLDQRPIKTDGTPQQQGSAETYAKRYALCSIFGIVGEEDDDANAATSVKECKCKYPAAYRKQYKGRQCPNCGGVL